MIKIVQSGNKILRKTAENIKMKIGLAVIVKAKK